MSVTKISALMEPVYVGYLTKHNVVETKVSSIEINTDSAYK